MTQIKTGVPSCGKLNWRGNHIAARLLKRMLKLGISRHEPDPMWAIEQAEARA